MEKNEWTASTKISMIPSLAIFKTINIPERHFVVSLILPTLQPTFGTSLRSLQGVLFLRKTWTSLEKTQETPIRMNRRWKKPTFCSSWNLVTFRYELGEITMIFHPCNTGWKKFPKTGLEITQLTITIVSKQHFLPARITGKMVVPLGWYP